MNIIEAILEAENGKLITNTQMKFIGHFLKYIKNGTFFEYEILPDGHSSYKYEVRNFSMGYILDTGWEVIDDKFLNPKKTTT